MRALGLWQPYAGLIRMGIKRIETRTWPMGPGRLLICSTLAIAPEARDVLARVRDRGFDVSDDILEDCGTMQCVSSIEACYLGSSIDERLACAPIEVTVDGKWIRKYCGFLAPPVPVVRHPVKCRQRWFDVDNSTIELEPGWVLP